MPEYALAESTVAMSAYNVLAMSPDSMSLPALHSVLSGYHPELPVRLLDKALHSLCERRYVRNVGEGFELADPERRLIRKRSREHDGWSGWMVQDKTSSKMIRIEQVIA